MIQIGWVLFWLALYFPGYALHTPVVVGTLPQGTLGWWSATCADGKPACYPDQFRYKITIDLAQIERYNAHIYGPWDKVVNAACIIIHEQAHVDTRSQDHRVPYERQLACYERFYAITPTYGIQQMMDWPRSELAMMPPRITGGSE